MVTRQVIRYLHVVLIFVATPYCKEPTRPYNPPDANAAVVTPSPSPQQKDQNSANAALQETSSLPSVPPQPTPVPANSPAGQPATKQATTANVPPQQAGKATDTTANLVALGNSTAAVLNGITGLVNATNGNSGYNGYNGGYGFTNNSNYGYVNSNSGSFIYEGQQHPTCGNDGLGWGCQFPCGNDQNPDLWCAKSSSYYVNSNDPNTFCTITTPGQSCY